MSWSDRREQLLLRAPAISIMARLTWRKRPTSPLSMLSEDHPDRCVLERALEALLALARLPVRLPCLSPDVLVQSPRRHRPGSRCRDEHAVDPRPAPRVRDGVGWL